MTDQCHRNTGILLVRFYCPLRTVTGKGIEVVKCRRDIHPAIMNESDRLQQRKRLEM